MGARGGNLAPFFEGVAMPNGIGDFSRDESGVKKGKGNEFPDFIPPNVMERAAAEYAAVREGVLTGVHADCSRKSEDEILDDWCRANGWQRKKVALAALSLNLVPESHYEALVGAATEADREAEALAAAREELEAIEAGPVADELVGDERDLQTCIDALEGAIAEKAAAKRGKAGGPLPRE